jgi:hypothetical protein
MVVTTSDTSYHEFMAPWLIIKGSGLNDGIYWHLLWSLLITINDCLRLVPFWLNYDYLLCYCDWLGSNFWLTHSWFTNDKWRIACKWIHSALHGRLYSLAVSVENVNESVQQHQHSRHTHHLLDWVSLTTHTPLKNISQGKMKYLLNCLLIKALDTLEGICYV